MKIRDLVHFIAAAETLHFPRAAERLGVSLPVLYSSLDRLEEEAGHPLFTKDGGKPALTPAGALLLDDARAEVAAAPAPAVAPKQKSTSGGKAKASKGSGRAPIVKGQPKPYKKRQGR
ncbi:LysR family transcriptional regulator [Microbacterium sp. cf332]|uniref:LysR family transcriptional regulator n=1 Tax=Microbacterium sp. cf332 TaxID=1761804 RepID=UPI00088441E0|nr:LysR family transcriptional regulator [Microbacterium sp. cf332]SDQ89449.1 regulatory helix-turn-helix protein, lysR family [Microbacterium sp. cf332]